jgi:cobalamin biosynthetic protein CobC
MLEHGGPLLKASRDFNIPVKDWLDLSTGINANSWPVPPPDPLIWQRLPESESRISLKS